MKAWLRLSILSSAIVLAAALTALAQETRPAATPPAGPPLTVTMQPHNGRPMLCINGKHAALPTYSPLGWSRPHFTNAVPFFTTHRMGAYFLCMPWVNGQGWAAAPLWDGDTISSNAIIDLPKNTFTFQDQVDFILTRDPTAYFFVRGLPDTPPASWRKLHADQMVIQEDGRTNDAPSLASDLFWDALARVARAGIQHVEAQPFANRVLGYWVGMFGEGSHPPLYTYYLFDHGPVMTAKWRAFLKEKYGTLDALRAAYGDTNMAFESASVPRDPLLGRQRDVAALLYWQGGADNRGRRDYLELTARLLHAGYAKIFAAVNDAVGGRKLCLYDAFKQTMLGWNLQGFFDTQTSWWPAYPEMMTGGGYIGVARLFGSPGFDGLVTPHDYQARGVGGIYEPEGIADSIVLRGKFFLCEMDTRTYNNPPFDYGSARDDKEYAAITWRNLATSFTRGFHSYWMDLCGKEPGWFGNTNIHAIIERQAQVIRESAAWSHEDVPGIAMILDDSAVLESNGSGNFFNEAIMWEQKMGLARCGVPYRIYLVEDLALANFPAHRVFYFPNLFRVDDARLALLRAKVFRDGNVVVWGPGSGISDGTSIVLPPVRKDRDAPAVTNPPIPATVLTGFEFDAIPANCQRRILLSDFSHPITAGLPADTIIGGPLAYGPALYPRADAGVVVLGGAWTKQGRNYAGLAVKPFGKGARGSGGQPADFGPGDWASVFTTAIPLPAGLWRNLARYAGAHVYADSGDIIMADRGLVALHSIQSGHKRIALPGKARVTDVITGKLVDRKTDAIEFELTAPGTAVFRLE